MDEVEEWVTVGEAARVAGRDKTTIRRWADGQLVVSRRSATGHRQVLLSSLRAVLNHSTDPVTHVDPTAGRVMLERWLREAKVLQRWVPDSRTPIPTLEHWQTHLHDIEDAVAAMRDELRQAIESAEYDRY